MLVLSRKVNESIIIGDNITVTIVAIRGGNVRLGVEAPAGVTVHREEIHRAIIEGRESQATTENKGLEATAQQSLLVEPKITSYEQFRTQLDKGNYKEAGGLYFVAERRFEASHDELEKLSGGLYGLVQRR